MATMRARSGLTDDTKWWAMSAATTIAAARRKNVRRRWRRRGTSRRGTACVERDGGGFRDLQGSESDPRFTGGGTSVRVPMASRVKRQLEHRRRFSPEGGGFGNSGARQVAGRLGVDVHIGRDRFALTLQRRDEV